MPLTPKRGSPTRKVRSIPKRTPLYDVHVMYRNPLTTKVRWVSTSRYNIPRAIAKSVEAAEETKPGVPYGTFAIILPNGTNVLEFLAKRKTHRGLIIRVDQPSKPPNP